MAKSAEPSNATVVLIAIMFLIYSAYQWAEKNINMIIAGLAALIFAYGAYRYIRAWRRTARLKERKIVLTEKYKSESIATKIMDQMFWEGQSLEQLLDSLGQPEAKDKQVLKTKTREVWKYGRTSSNQFSLRITLENGKVVGWEQKS